MDSQHGSHAPSWYGIPVRALLVTFIGTLLCFAVSLLFGIVGMVVVAAAHGTHPDMRIAYRDIAIPIALVAGSVIFVLALTMEIRRYRQVKTLSTIEKIS